MASSTEVNSGKSTASKIPGTGGKSAPSHATPQGLAPGTGDIWAWVEENAKLLAVLLLILVLAGAGYSAVQAIHDHQEKSAQNALYVVEGPYNKLKEGFDKAKFQQFAPKDEAQDKNAPAPKAATGDLKQDYGNLISDFEKVAHEHAGTTAGAQAAMIAAQTYLDYKQPDKAIEMAQLAAGRLGEKSLLNQLSTVVWGNALADKGDCTQAVSVWQKVLDNKDAAFLQGDVSLRAGVCYEQMNQPERAAEMYRKASADSGAGKEAKAYLRALTIKNPKLATPAAAPTKEG